jgi:hypothetical protein
VQANRYWKTSLYKPEESLDFFDEFAAIPTCSVDKSGSLFLYLEGRPEAERRWRDWFALRLMNELQAEFKEITGCERITYCVEERENETG